MGRAESLVKLYFRKRETICPTTGHSTSSMITKFEDVLERFCPTCQLQETSLKLVWPKKGPGNH